MRRLRLLTLCHAALFASVLASGLAAHPVWAVAGHAILLFIWSFTFSRSDWPHDWRELSQGGTLALTLVKLAIVAVMAALVHLAGRGLGVAFGWQASWPVWVPLVTGLAAILICRVVCPPRHLDAMNAVLAQAVASITEAAGTSRATEPATLVLAETILALPDDASPAAIHAVFDQAGAGWSAASLVFHLAGIRPLPRAARLATILLATDPRHGPEVGTEDAQMWIFDLAEEDDALLAIFGARGIALLQQEPDLARAFPFAYDVVLAADRCSDAETAGTLRQLAEMLNALRADPHDLSHG